MNTFKFMRPGKFTNVMKTIFGSKFWIRMSAEFGRSVSCYLPFWHDSIENLKVVLDADPQSSDSVLGSFIYDKMVHILLLLVASIHGCPLFLYTSHPRSDMPFSFPCMINKDPRTQAAPLFLFNDMANDNWIKLEKIQPMSMVIDKTTILTLKMYENVFSDRATSPQRCLLQSMRNFIFTKKGTNGEIMEFAPFRESFVRCNIKTNESKWIIRAFYYILQQMAHYMPKITPHMYHSSKSLIECKIKGFCTNIKLYQDELKPLLGRLL